MAVSKDFADYCCELLSGVGNPTAKRMFGGFAVYGVPKSVNYYAAPDDAMESPDAMLPWARLAFRCALEAKATAKTKAKTKTKSSSRSG